MNRLTTLLAFLLFTFISSCGQENISFSFSTPQNWHLTETTNKYQELHVKIEEPITELSASFPRNIIIGITHAEDLHDYVNAYLKQLKQSVIFCKTFKLTSTTIDRRKPECIRYQVQINLQTQLAEQKIHFVEKHNRIFQIVCNFRRNELTVFKKKLILLSNHSGAFLNKRQLILQA